MIIEEEWFDDMNLTDGATFPQALIKRAKNRFNKNIFLRDTKQHIREIATRSGWNTYSVQILRKKC